MKLQRKLIAYQVYFRDFGEERQELLVLLVVARDNLTGFRVEPRPSQVAQPFLEVWLISGIMVTNSVAASLTKLLRTWHRRISINSRLVFARAKLPARCYSHKISRADTIHVAAAHHCTLRLSYPLARYPTYFIVRIGVTPLYIRAIQHFDELHRAVATVANANSKLWRFTHFISGSVGSEATRDTSRLARS